MINMAVTTALHYIVCVYVLSVAILAQAFGWLLGEALGRRDMTIARVVHGVEILAVAIWN